MSLWLMLLAIWLVPAVPTWLGMLLLPLRRYGWPGLGSFTAAMVVFAIISLVWPLFIGRDLVATVAREDFEREWLLWRRPVPDPDPRLTLVLVARPRVVISVDRVERERLESHR